MPFPITTGSIGQQIRRVATLGLGMGQPVRGEPGPTPVGSPGFRHRDRPQQDFLSIPFVAGDSDKDSIRTDRHGVLWTELRRSSKGTSLFAERSSAIALWSSLPAGRIESLCEIGVLTGLLHVRLRRSKSGRSMPPASSPERMHS